MNGPVEASQIKQVVGGEPITARSLPKDVLFKPSARLHRDGRPSERWDGEKWVPWDWRNDRGLGEHD